MDNQNKNPFDFNNLANTKSIPGTSKNNPVPNYPVPNSGNNNSGYNNPVPNSGNNNSGYNNPGPFNPGNNNPVNNNSGTFNPVNGNPWSGGFHSEINNPNNGNSGNNGFWGNGGNIPGMGNIESGYIGTNKDIIDNKSKSNDNKNDDEKNSNVGNSSVKEKDSDHNNNNDKQNDSTSINNDITQTSSIANGNNTITMDSNGSLSSQSNQLENNHTNNSHGKPKRTSDYPSIIILVIVSIGIILLFYIIIRRKYKKNKDSRYKQRLLERSFENSYNYDTLERSYQYSLPRMKNEDKNATETCQEYLNSLGRLKYRTLTTNPLQSFHSPTLESESAVSYGGLHTPDIYQPEPIMIDPEYEPERAHSKRTSNSSSTLSISDYNETIQPSKHSNKASSFIHKTRSKASLNLLRKSNSEAENLKKLRKCRSDNVNVLHKKYSKLSSIIQINHNNKNDNGDQYSEVSSLLKNQLN